MNISAINSNNQTNFKSNEIGEIAKSVKELSTKKFGELGADDFNGIAHKIDADRATSPFSYFLATAALSAASFLAARRASLATIKGMEGKFPLYNTVDSAANVFNKYLNKAKKSVAPAQIKDVRSFFQNTANSAVKWADDFASKGITEADRTIHKGSEALLQGKNAVRKVASNTIGAGAALATVTTRSADENGNGIPDGAENNKKGAMRMVKQVVEAIPTVAAAVNLV